MAVIRDPMNVPGRRGTIYPAEFAAGFGMTGAATLISVVLPAPLPVALPPYPVTLFEFVDRLLCAWLLLADCC